MRTTRSFAQMFVGGLCSMSRFICMILIADLTACRLNFFHECCGMWTSNSEAVEWVPCVAAVDGACAPSRMV